MPRSRIPLRAKQSSLSSTRSLAGNTRAGITRLAFNRIVVLRYRSHLESRQLAPGTVNLRLGAVRRLAYEASDCGLLSADLAAGIRRVRGVKKIGVRLGNWLLPDQAMALLGAPDPETMKGKRDLALLTILVACGLRRHEAV